MAPRPFPVSPQMPPPSPPPFVRLRSFLRHHPVLFLVLLAPQVEYLSGSSQLSYLVGVPPIFFLFLAQNLGSYGLAVLLIREARIRWKLGWASVLLLGAAYGLLNEGIGAATLFNPSQTIFGGPPGYSHLLGVNWVLATQLVIVVHPLFSVSLPLVEFDLAFPETRGMSLVKIRQAHLALVGLAADGIFTLLLVSAYLRHYWVPPVLLGICGALIGALVLAARRAPSQWLLPPNPTPTARPLTFFVLGAGFYWALTIGSGVLINTVTVPVLVSTFVVGAGGLALFWVVRHAGRHENELQFTALAAGLVFVSLAPQGFISQLGTGLAVVPVVGGDLLALAFFLYLWKRYSPCSRPGGQ
ncbi:MAG: hypothetical protein L3K14_02205 [Thermoplasmata archaeon]|nr:hypothetical protein [Thermoplasmata archaeon]